MIADKVGEKFDVNWWEANVWKNRRLVMDFITGDSIEVPQNDADKLRDRLLLDVSNCPVGGVVGVNWREPGCKWDIEINGGIITSVKCLPAYDSDETDEVPEIGSSRHKPSHHRSIYDDWEPSQGSHGGGSNL